MNNSKKLKVKKVKEVKISEKPITSVSKPWLITSLVLIVILIGGLLFDQLYTPNLMTVDGKKYTLKDLSYYFYTVETNYASYNQMFGGDYWDTPFQEDGTTMRETAKQDAVDTSLRSIILYNEAVAKDYTLTDDEKKTVKTKVDSLIKEQLTKEVISKNHFSKAYLTDVLGQATLVSRFRQDQIDAANIDEDKIKEGVSKEDFRQYDIEYLYATTQTTDADGNTVAVSDDEKKAALDQLTTYYDKAKTTADWTDLVPTEDTAVIHKTTNFIKSDTTFSDDFKTMMMKMDNNAVSEIYEDETGYYIVRMVDNNSTERYDSEVESAITTAENEAFDKIYEEIKATHTYKLKDNAIKKLKMGTLTLAD